MQGTAVTYAWLLQQEESAEQIARAHPSRFPLPLNRSKFSAFVLQVVVLT